MPQVRKERMNLDAQTLGMERELATYGMTLYLLPAASAPSHLDCCTWKAVKVA